MFRNLRPTFAAVAALAILAPCLAGAEAIHYRSSGDSAYASFYDVDATGCIWRYTDVSVTAGRFRTEPGPSLPQTYLDLSVFEYDYCQFIQISSVFASATIPDDAFRLQGALQSASVQATVDAYDWVTGTFEPVTVDLVWAGDGDIYRGHSTNHTQYPGGRYFTRSSGSTRLATPSGSVTVRSTNLVAGAESVYGSLSSGQSAITSIFRVQ